MNYGPDFICIGTQKSGTSWLQLNLHKHPDTCMPPEKEVNFFPRHPSWLMRRYFPKLIAHLHNWRILYDKYESAMESKGQDPNVIWYWENQEWYRQYLFGRRFVQDYSLLFPKEAGKISGDISPTYALLTRRDVYKLSLAAPNAKIIYLLRNPMDRVWSVLKMLSTIPTFNLSLSEHNILKLINTPKYSKHIFKNCEYHKVAALWEQFFPGRVKVWFYEQLQDNPAQKFSEICEFLAINSNIPSLDFSQEINSTVYKGRSDSLPTAIHDLLADKLAVVTHDINRTFNNQYTNQWVNMLSR